MNQKRYMNIFKESIKEFMTKKYLILKVKILVGFYKNMKTNY